MQTPELQPFPNYLQRSIYQLHLILNAIKMILRFPAFLRGQDEARCPELIREGEGRGEKKIRFTPCQDFSSDLTSFAERNQKKPPFGVKALIAILTPPGLWLAGAAGLCHSRLLRLGVGEQPLAGPHSAAAPYTVIPQHSHLI